MRGLTRWLRFNAVGAVGMAVQTIALACLHRVWPSSVVLASISAVEITLMHNFLWHMHYTWRDRPSRDSRAVQFLRFQSSNGLVSLVGNAAIIHLLVTQMHITLLVANGIAILFCSIVNFCLGDAFVFVTETDGLREA